MSLSTNETTTRKKVLIVATTHWISTARLAMTLAALGCRVELMAPKNHPALVTGCISRHHTYWPMRPLTGLRRALTRGKPDLLLLADELGFLLVEELALWAGAVNGSDADAIAALLRRSFGNLESLPVARSRLALLTTAQAAGVPIPSTMPLRDKGDVEDLRRNLPGPWMLKADATWGGFGVRKVSTPDQLAATRRQLQQPLNLPRSLKRGWTGKEWGHLHVWLRGSKRDVIAQSFVQGRERNALVLCSQGRLCAAVCFEVEEACYANGPASIVRVVEDKLMLDSMRRTVAALGLSGFCGFDFMLHAETGEPLLLEMNTRPTQLAHLPFGAGQDLCSALMREVLGCDDVSDRPNVAISDRVALFPQEVRRDPTGSRLAQAFHDVPWAAPRLMQRAVAPDDLPRVLTADSRWSDNAENQHASQKAVILSRDHA